MMMKDSNIISGAQRKIFEKGTVFEKGTIIFGHPVLLNFYVSFYVVFCHIVMSSLLARLDLAAVRGSDECEHFPF
jgi:hypothetical protein